MSRAKRIAACVAAAAAFLAAAPLSAGERGETVREGAVTGIAPVDSVVRFLSGILFGRRPERAVFYVSPSGSIFGDGSAQSPWQRLDQAVSFLRAGDTLYLAEGTYREAGDLAASGREDAWITIEGLGEAEIDGSALYKYNPVFDTHGHSFIRFKNITVLNARAGVEIRGGSHHIEIDGLVTDRCQFAVKMRNASFVTIRNATATRSRNAFRGDGKTHDVLIENAKGFFSQDVYPGYDPDYLNGDAFIFENRTRRITIRDSVGAENWDAGFDIKAHDARLENITAYGNKNGLKLWGKNITVVNALVYGQRSEPRSEKGPVDGMGVNVRRGSARIVHATFVDNEGEDVKVADRGHLRLENSIVARRGGGGKLLGKYGHFSQDRVLWYRHPAAPIAGADGSTDPGSQARDETQPDFKMPEGGFWSDPGFVDWEGGDFHLRAGSPAIDRGAPLPDVGAHDLEGRPRAAGAAPDLGAYEFEAGENRTPSGGELLET